MPITAKTPLSSSSIPAHQILERARHGHLRSRSELQVWVYREGMDYFLSKVGTERLLSRSEAQDLAGECLLEFQKALPRIRSLSRYCRKMFRNNLIRHLTRKRSRQTRERCQEESIIQYQGYVSGRGLRLMEFEIFSDMDLRKLNTTRRKLKQVDPVMKQVFELRTAEEPLSYKQIGAIVGLGEAALRMRVTRFCRSVRDEHYAQERIRGQAQIERRTVNPAPF